MSVNPAFCRTQLNNKGNDFPFCDRKTASTDCNVAMASECVEIITGHQLTADQCRKISGELIGPTGKALAREVFDSENMMAGTDYIMLTKQPVQTIRDLLNTGWFVVGFIDYSVINATLGGQYSSDKGFQGAHAIGMSGWWKKVNRRTNFYDPLADGRRPAIHLGVQDAPFAMLRDAMAAYSGPGLASGYAVKP